MQRERVYAMNTMAKGFLGSPKTIICLEGSDRLCESLKRSLEGGEDDCPFVLMRSPEAAADVLALCRRLVPALVAIEDTRLHLLPLDDLHDLIGRRDIQLIVFSDKQDEKSHFEFFHMGCVGVLSSTADALTVRTALERISAGEFWLPRKVLSNLAHQTFFRLSGRTLTTRETDILKLIRQGLTNQQIADMLFISRETVRWHVRGLYSKIGVGNRAAAIRFSEGEKSNWQIHESGESQEP
jgi:DNA-binding NarL/FixJ family response regulator